MLPIKILTESLKGLMTRANIGILLELVVSFLTCKDKITTKSLSRYIEYSSRSIFRFLQTEYDWVIIRIKVFKALIFNSETTYIAAADEVVEGKSRKSSYGISMFYSSIVKKPINGICFFALSLIDVKKRCSYMLGIEQVVYTAADKAVIKANKAKAKASKERSKAGTSLAKGRKQGTKNNAEKPNNTASFRSFTKLWTSVMSKLRQLLSPIRISHLVGDAAYGTIDYLKIALEQGCFLISKLIDTTALYDIYRGTHGNGFYGDKIDWKNLSDDFLVRTEQLERVTHFVYQIKAYNKSIGRVLLNVVIVKHLCAWSGKTSFSVWFTNDLDLNADTLLDYYSLRFQIEFDFRDAKQHFGLSDFKNYKPQNLTNFVNLSFFMCLISKPILDFYRQLLLIPKLSITDLKTIFYQRFVAKKIIKLIQNEPVSIFKDGFILSLLPDDLVNRA